MEELINQLTQALGAILAAALVALVVQGLRKLGVTLTTDKQHLLETIVKQGVSYAEEEAKNYLTKQGQKMESTLKQKMAIDYVISKLPKTSRDDVAQVIQAVMPMVRPTLDRGTTTTTQ